MDKVWGYDAATLTWSSYKAGAPSDLAAMVDGKGYWIFMTAPAVLTVSGIDLPLAPITPPSYSVVPGWNLLGFKSTVVKTADFYLAAIPGKYTSIYGFTNGAYVAVYNSGGVVPGSDNLTPGAGYWVAIIAAGTIYP